MINSLFKDSHITQSLCHPQFYSGRGAGKNERQEYSNATLNNSIEKSINKPADKVNFRGLSNAKKPFNIYTNKYVKNFLKMADESQPLFNATFSLFLTCLLRPASIMALPSDKKNIDDKKYAATQSIASGIISYGFSQVIFSPIADGMKKVLAHPEDYLKKANSLLTDKTAREAGGTLVKMLPEAFLAAPRAIVTVALIPPVLKYVFGWEKKQTNHKQEQTKNISGGVK